MHLLYTHGCGVVVGGLGVENQQNGLSEAPPCDLFLWGLAKEDVDRSKPSTLSEVEQQIRDTVLLFLLTS
jgi:hypothetical protein